MKKCISLFLLLFLAIIFQNKAFAASIELNSLDRVIIKFVELDGSVKEDEIIKNDSVECFEQSIKERLGYYYNKYNIKEIISINDIPLKDTQFMSYSGVIKVKEEPNQQNAQNNQNQSLEFSKSGYLIMLDNTTYTGIEISPYVKNGTTYIEISPVLEALGYEVTTIINGYYKALTAHKKEIGKELWIDIAGESKNAYKSNEGLIALDKITEIKDLSFCIPVKSAEKLLGTSIIVNFSKKLVEVTKR